MKRLSLKKKTVYEEDVRRIINACLCEGYVLSSLEAFLAWRNVSSQMNAHWSPLPGERQIFPEIMRHGDLECLSP